MTTNRASLSQFSGLFRDRTARVVAMFLFLAVVVVFIPCLRNQFLNFDDDLYITENHAVQQGLTWANFKWAMTSFVGGIWHPLTWLTIMLDCQLYGLHPAGHHFTSILLHAGSVVLLFAFLRRATGALWSSAFVAALFGLHPLRVESVVWPAERKDVLCTFFWMLALLAYARFAESLKGGDPHAKRWYVLTLLAFVCGLMSKTTIVTLPVLLLLLDWWPLGRFQAGVLSRGNFSILLEKVPFFAGSAAASLLSIISEHTYGGLVMAADCPISNRLENAVLAIAHYLGMIFLPLRLAVYYPLPQSFNAWAVAGALLLFVLLSGLALRASPRRAFVGVGWIWFLVTLLPVIGIFQLGGQARADRYLYMPSVGIFLVIAWCATGLARGKVGRLLLWGLALLALTGVVVQTSRQIGYWKDSQSLFARTLEVTENNALAHRSMGGALLEKGDLAGAITHFREASRIAPSSTDGLNNLGAALLIQGQTDEAIAVLQRAVELKPGLAETHAILGTALARKGLLAEAALHLGESVRLAPRDAAAHANLGAVLLDLGELANAASELRAALALKPELADAHRNLGLALGRMEKPQEAVEELEQAAGLAPADLQTQLALGITFGKLARFEEAAAHFRRATELNPQSAEAFRQLGTALSRLGRLDDAASSLRKALELAPNSADVHCGLGAVLCKQGRVEDGIGELREALRLDPNHHEATENLRVALALKKP